MRPITEPRLQAAVRNAGYPEQVFEQIRAQLAAEPQTAASFEAAHIAYYLGALLIIGAMGWFITQAWDSLAGITLTAIAATYAIVFGGAGYVLSQRPNSRVPGGILVTIAVSMMPMIVYGIERQFHLWPSDDPGKYSDFHPYIRSGWVYMELFTVLASFIALRFIRFAFVTAPGAYALWYLSMDGTALLFGHSWTFQEEAHISVIFGLVIMLVAFFLDGERDVDLAFWFYLFGLLTFSGSLSLWEGGTQLGKAIYCLLHVALIVLSVVLQRRAFLVFGALGVLFYIGDEAYGFFKDSISFTFGLTAIGIAFIVLGLLYKRSEPALTHALLPFIPDRIRRLHGLEAA